MKSATFRATVRAVLFATALLVTGTTAADGEAMAASPLPTASVVRPGETPEAGAAERRDVSADLLPTLGAIALGIIGLLWARRHTAER
jgi:hypothetical protein